MTKVTIVKKLNQINKYIDKFAKAKTLVAKRAIVKKIKATEISLIKAMSLHRSNPPIGEDFSDNPAALVEVYDRLEAIEAQKGPKSGFPNEKFRHDFEKEPKAKLFGVNHSGMIYVNEGDLVAKSTGRKKLWNLIKYPD